MIESAAILPTGEEIRDGIVLDTNSPEVMRQLLRLSPACRIMRWPPIADNEEDIKHAIEAAAAQSSIVVLIGGSGGGHRHSSTLHMDFTHSALEALLPLKYSHEIYGKNGHLWCKLVCGKINDALIMNLPGPFVEASAAMVAFCNAFSEDPGNLAAINKAMAGAVLAQYPSEQV